MVNPSIVGGDVAVIKEQTLLHYHKSAFKSSSKGIRRLHLLKLVTGVEISTRAVIKSGRPGKPVKRRSRTAAAVLKRTAFLLSILIVGDMIWAKERGSIAIWVCQAMPLNFGSSEVVSLKAASRCRFNITSRTFACRFIDPTSPTARL